MRKSPDGWALFAAERRAGEGFGDFCHRVGAEHLLAPFTEPLKEAS